MQNLTNNKAFASIDDIMELIGCNRRKAGQIMKEVKDTYPEATLPICPRLVKYSCLYEYIGLFNEKGEN